MMVNPDKDEADLFVALLSKLRALRDSAYEPDSKRAFAVAITYLETSRLWCEEAYSPHGE